MQTAFPGDNRRASAGSRRALCICFYEYWERCVLKVWDLIKLIHCIASFSIFSNHKLVVGKKIMTISKISCQNLISHANSFIHCCLVYHQWKGLHSELGRWRLCVIRKDVLTLRSPCQGLRGFGFRNHLMSCCSHLVLERLLYQQCEINSMWIVGMRGRTKPDQW